MADLMRADLLTFSSLDALRICLPKSAETRNAMSGYFGAVFVLFIVVFFLCWLVLHLYYTSLYDVKQPVSANLFAEWLSDGYMTVK